MRIFTVQTAMYMYCRKCDNGGTKKVSKNYTTVACRCICLNFVQQEHRYSLDKYPITYCGIEPGRDCTHVTHMFKQQHLLNGAEEAPEDWSAVNLNNTL